MITDPNPKCTTDENLIEFSAIAAFRERERERMAASARSWMLGFCFGAFVFSVVWTIWLLDFAQ